MKWASGVIPVRKQHRPLISFPLSVNCNGIGRHYVSTDSCLRGLVNRSALGAAPGQLWHIWNQKCVSSDELMTLQIIGPREKHRHGARATLKSTYHLLIGRQHLLDHHAVPGERAAVQRVGPIRTEGTQAWCGCRSSHGGYQDNSHNDGEGG